MIKEMKQNKLITILFICSLLFFSYFGIGCNEKVYLKTTQPYDLVDSSKHCKYVINTKYSSEAKKGISVWNKYKKGILTETTNSNNRDVIIIDYDGGITRWVGQTDFSTGTIRISKHWAKHLEYDYFPDRAQGVVMHEIGHALGLGDNTSNEKAVMYYEGGGLALIKLTGDDKASFDAAAKRY